LDASGNVLEHGKRRETRRFNGRTYLMEEALTGDVAIIRAWKADEAGNCMFRLVFISSCPAPGIKS
jgi:3-oxoacid CoA-transferase